MRRLSNHSNSDPALESSRDQIDLIDCRLRQTKAGKPAYLTALVTRANTRRFDQTGEHLINKLDDELAFSDCRFVPELTKRQREILEFICRHQVEQGYWPSIRDIQRHFNFKSTNAVVGHVRALEKKGALNRVPGQARAYRPAGFDSGRPLGADEVVDIPVFGDIAAGFPDGVESGDAVGRLQVDLSSISSNGGKRAFALRVRGESMIDAGITDGDTVIVDPRSPRDGDIVVALIDGQSTLKRFIRPEAGAPFLKSENVQFPSMHPVTELIIQGVATSLVRKLQ